MKQHQRIIPAMVSLIALHCGCHSFHVQDYVSPRVTGRVLDAETRSPVPNVTVQKVTGDQSAQSGFPPKGGEQMLASGQVHTDKDGLFEMAAEKDVLTFSGGVYLVRLQFQHSNYETLRTNYSGKHITDAGPKSPPELNAGEILMKRLEQ